MKNDKGRYIFNILLEDIEIDYDKKGDNPKHFKIKAGDIKYFPNSVADNLREKIATRALDKNYPSDKNRYKRLQELYSEIEIDHD